MPSSVQQLQNQIDRLYRRILCSVAPVKILATNDADPIHKVQVRVQSTPEILDDVGVQQIYGIASHAPVGTDATALFVAGNRANAMIVSTGNQQYRLRNLKPGEIALYTDEGDTLQFNRDNKVNLNSKDSVSLVGQNAVSVSGQNSVTVDSKSTTVKGSDEVKLDAPTTTVTQNLKANGQVDASGGFFQNGQAIGGSGGAPGPQGPAGPPGQAATITIGTVTTLPPGSQATVENVGTPTAAILNFGIPGAQ